MSDITGRLENWVLAPWGEDSVVWGNLYDDSKERFSDGTFIHTSSVESIVLIENVKYVQTRYSRYALGEQAPVPGVRNL